MNAIVKQIEKAKPVFDKLAANIYLGAIRDGFLTAMPAILFSSLFILVASIPEIFGVVLPEAISNWLWRIYNLSMGMVAILVAATTAKSLADSMNRKLPVTQQINNVSVMLASICGLLMLAVTEIDGGIDVTYLGTRGLLCSFISAFVTCNLYKFCAIKNITIPMPEEVPGVISSVFRNLFPFSFSVFACCLLNTFTDGLFGLSFAEGVIRVMQPLFTAADSYVGICIIWGAMALFWFVGVHGPSIVEPAIAAIIYANVETNLMLYQEGKQASLVLTAGLGNFIGTMGGTGATLVVPFLMLIFCKSKQLKAVGKAAVVPCCFAVNEPLLFATPIVLNPYFFVPFLVTPMVNVCLFKFFVDVFKMNSFMYVLPWATPAPLGLILGTGMSVLSIILAVLLIAVDCVIYLPFIRAYDASLCKEEAMKMEEIEEEKIDEAAELALIESVREAAPEEGINVLVLCVGAGTSAMFANAVKKGAAEKNVPIDAMAGAYGSHTDILKNYDLVVLSPQVHSHYDEVKHDADQYGIKVVPTKGAQYINLTRDPSAAVDFVLEQYRGEAGEKTAESKAVEAKKAAEPKTAAVTGDGVNVLVLCVGAGTSAMFANALKKGAKAKGVNMDAMAGAYGSHTDILKNYDLVVLSPQVQSHYDEVRHDADQYGIQVVPTKGAQYIALTRDPEGAVDFVLEQLNKNQASKDAVASEDVTCCTAG